MLAIGDENGRTYLWDTRKNKVTATLTDPASKGVGDDRVAFGPGGDSLAVGDSTGSTYLWNISTRKITATLIVPGGKIITSVAFGPRGTTLATVNGNGNGNGNGNVYL